MIKSSDKLVLKKLVKKRDRVMKKLDRGKFWTKNRDCPSKSGTVGGYVAITLFHTINIIYLSDLHWKLRT